MQDRERFEKYAKTRDINERNAIVEDYLYIVDILVRKYLNKGVEYDDLYQVGAMALIMAVERFDASRGFEFSSFATPTILGEIKKYFRDKEWKLKVPRSVKEANAAIQSARESLFAKLQRDPTVKEIAEEKNMKEEEVAKLIDSSMAYNTLSLDVTFDDSGSDSGVSRYEKYMAVEGSGIESLEYEEMIESILSVLSEKNRYIFKKRFLEGKTQSEIAEKLGVSQMTISRAEKEIKEKFKEELKRGEYKV